MSSLFLHPFPHYVLPNNQMRTPPCFPPWGRRKTFCDSLFCIPGRGSQPINGFNSEKKKIGHYFSKFFPIRLNPFHLYEAIPIINRYASSLHCILVDSSAVICWMSPFVIFGVPGLFVTFIIFFYGKSC